MDKDLIIHKLTEENGALAEALGQSTEARGRQMDRIAQLERDLADAHAQIDALEGARRVLSMLVEPPDLPVLLTDRDPWPDGGGYDVGEVWVRELEAAE